MRETKYFCDRCKVELSEKAGDWLTQTWECKADEKNFQLHISSGYPDSELCKKCFDELATTALKKLMKGEREDA